MPTIPYKNKDGKRISGTTTIISQNLGWNKEPLKYWGCEQGQKYPDLPPREALRKDLDEACDAGTLCHAMIDANIKNHEIDLGKATEEVIGKAYMGFNNFLEWKKMVNLRTLVTEVNLVSEQWQYGATPDLIGIVADKLALVDWKTSKGLYADHLLQLAAYEYAWEENNPDKPLDGGYHLLRVDKETGAFHHHHWDKGVLRPAWTAFLNLLNLHKLKKEIERLT